MRKIFIITIFLLSFSAFVKAQEIMNYVHLEVTDSYGKPVQDAKVELGPTVQMGTDTEGRAFFRLHSGYRDFKGSIFKVSMDGYFPFQDFGATIQGTDWNTSITLELLKKPQTSQEKRLIGNEQIKREFMWAAKTGDAETVRKLLKKGISPNLQSQDLRGVPIQPKIPAVLFAAVSGNGETVSTLIKAGAKVKSKEKPWRNILLYYLSANPFSKENLQHLPEKTKLFQNYEEGFRSLLKGEADIYALGEFDETALMIAAQKGYINIVKTLLNRNLRLDIKNKNGNTALNYAVSYDQETNFFPSEMVSFLIKAGANPNHISISNNYCETALMRAALNSSLDIIKALIIGKADVNLSCPNGETALTKAVALGQVESVRLLIELGADLSDKQGQIALTKAKELSAKYIRLNRDTKNYTQQVADFNEIINLLEVAGAK